MTFSTRSQMCGVVSGSLLKLSSAAQRNAPLMPLPALHRRLIRPRGINEDGAGFTVRVTAFIIPRFCGVKGQ